MKVHNYIGCLHYYWRASCCWSKEYYV